MLSAPIFYIVQGEAHFLSLLVCCCHLSEVLCSNFGSIAAWKLLRDVSKVIKLPFYNKPNLFFGFHICIQAGISIYVYDGTAENKRNLCHHRV